MRRKIKQALALLLVVASLIACIPAVMAAEDQTSGTVPVTISASAPTFSVSVPTTLPIHMDANGDITCGDITVTNSSAGPVLVNDTQVTALNGWTLADYATTTFTDSDRGQRRVALQINRGSGVTASGADTGEDFIPAGGSQTVSVSAKIPNQGVEAVNTSIAQVVFVLGWRKAVPVDGITITGSEFVYAGDTIKLSATKAPPNATSTATVSWHSSNTNIASVDLNGFVTGVGTGSVTISATCDGVSAEKTITVFPAAPDSVSGVKLTVGSSLWSDLSWPAQVATQGKSPYGGAYSYSATFANSLSSDAMDQSGSVTIPLLDGWQISNPEMHVVSTNGSSNNDQTVSLNGDNGQYGYYFYWPNFSGPSLWAGDYTFTVTFILERANNVYLRDLTITGEDSVEVGSSIQLSAQKVPENTTDTGTISWSSSNTSVATVSNDGVVTGKSRGTAVITASCNGITATKTIISKGGISASDTYTVHLYGPTQANCVGGRVGVCKYTYGQNFDGIFGGFIGASGEHYIEFSSSSIPSSAIQSFSVNGTAFTFANGRWIYNGYLPGGSDISFRIELKDSVVVTPASTPTPTSTATPTPASISMPTEASTPLTPPSTPPAQKEMPAN